MENRGLQGILKKSKKVYEKKIPTRILDDTSENIPEVIIVKYRERINVDQIDEVIRFKLKKLKKIDLLQQYSETSLEKILMYKNFPTKENLEDYLDICSIYIRIERIKNIDYIFNCKGCNNSLENLKEDSEGVVTCPKCNCINTYMKPNNYQRDLEKFNYCFDEDVNNFIKILDKFEGKTNLMIKVDFIDLLDGYFLNIGLKSGAYYKKLPLTIDGKKKGTSRKLLWVALEKIGYSQYYDEVSYIANIYWGWSLPDLTKYKDQLIKDYQMTQNIWNLIKGDYKRSASLGTQFRLYVQLKAVGYPNADRDDFKIQDNIESLRLHNECWKIMCEKSNIEYHYVTT